jgi:hypothetical protein
LRTGSRKNGFPIHESGGVTEGLPTKAFLGTATHAEPARSIEETFKIRIPTMPIGFFIQRRFNGIEPFPKDDFADHGCLLAALESTPSLTYSKD